MNTYDVVVIGGGPGGCAASNRASQLGGRVLLVEKDKLGGICLNWGCIPMEVFFRYTKLLAGLKEGEDYGINVGQVSFDVDKLMRVKTSAISNVGIRARKGLEANHVEIVKGFARLASPNQVEIGSDSGMKQFIQTKGIIVTAGSAPRRLTLPGFDSENVITLKEAFELDSIPESAVIVGAGVTGVELASFWAQAGCKVSVVVRRPHILPQQDGDLSAAVEKALRDKSVQIYTSAEFKYASSDHNGFMKLTVMINGVKQEVGGEKIVLATGQVPVIEGLGLEKVGVDVKDGRIQANERMETNVTGIYAAGDVTGEILLASVAVVQGTVAAENCLGGNSTVDYRAVPKPIRTLPEIASVGILEKEAYEKGLDTVITKFPLSLNSKASILKGGEGFIKLIAARGSGEILGVLVVGPQAIEVISQATMVLHMRGTVKDLATAHFGHPTVHEAIRGAARDLWNKEFYRHGSS